MTPPLPAVDEDGDDDDNGDGVDFKGDVLIRNGDEALEEDGDGE
jgi:hypothetical protein